MKDQLKKIRFIRLLLDLRLKHFIYKTFREDATFFYKHRNRHDESASLEYLLMMHLHCIEKGMGAPNPRIFGIKHIKEIIQIERKLISFNETKSFAYQLALSTLKEYLKFFEEHDWQESQNYQIVQDFLKDLPSKSKQKVNIPSGVNTQSLSKIQKKCQINYLDFVDSRHSIREVSNRPISNNDLQYAIKSASKTPSACNRQMIKIYHIKSPSKITKLKPYINGLTCFDLESFSYFIITFDSRAFLDFSEHNQGFFNAGLFSTNFINALHSRGIGSCFLQCNNPLKEETPLKKTLNIPDNERIAVFIAAGYYRDNVKSLKSARRPIEEIFKTI